MLRRLWGIVVTALALVIILAAVVVGIGRLLIPYADQARPWLEDYLTGQLGEEVNIERIEAEWPRLTPRITLQTVRVGTADDPMARMDQARVEVHLRHLVRPERNVVNLIVLGLDLVLAEDETGHWGLRLEGGGRMWASEGDEPLAGDLILRDARVQVVPRELPVSDWQLEEAQVRRSGERSIVLGRLTPANRPGARMEVRVQAEHPGGRIRHVEGWAGIRDLTLDAGLAGRLLPDWPASFGAEMDAGLWVTWTVDELARLDAEFSVDAGRGGVLSGQLGMAREPSGRIDAELRSLMLDGAALADDVVMAQKDGRWAFAFENLDLAAAHALSATWLSEEKWWPESVDGRIEDLGLLYEPGVGLHALRGHITDFGMAPVARSPGVSGLDVALSLDGDRIAMRPSGQPRIHWPTMLRREIVLDHIDGRVVVSPEGAELDGVAIGHPVIDTTADGWIYFGDQRPFLDFRARVDRASAADPPQWLPHGIVPDRALAWLDQALAGFGQARGDINFHLRAGRKARDFQPGDFQAHVEFSDGRLDYWPEWPSATRLAGELDFIGHSLTGRVESGRLGRLNLAADQVVIPNLTRPELSMLLATDRGNADALAEVLADMPVPAFAAVAEPTDWSGPVSLAVEVVLPFRRMAEWQIDGELSLDGVDFGLPRAGLGLDSLTGTAFFDREQLLPCVLHAMSGARMVTLDLSADFGPSPRLQIGGQLHPRDIIRSAGPLERLSGHLIGSTYWELDLQPAVGGGLQIALASDLEGIVVELPEPLSKLAAQRWPLALEMAFDESDLQARLTLADQLDAIVRQREGAWSAGLGLGGWIAQLPEAAGFDVRGRIESLEARAWLDLLGQGGAGLPSNGGEGQVSLEIGRFNFGDLFLDDLSVAVERAESDWIMELGGPAAEGRITVPVPLDSGRVLAVDLGRMYLGRTGFEGESFRLDTASGAGQTSTASPAGAPPLHLLIEDLRYRDLELGRARIESHVVGDGVEVERFDIDGPMGRLSGIGRWRLGEQGPYSEFDGRLVTTALSRLLAGLGFEAGIDAARAQVDIVGRWPGAPQDFTLRRLEGDLGVDIRDGVIPEARPGAGRLLGLVSLNAIPRRLMLDFRDVFSQGLKFDAITGQFGLGDGMASTEGIRIDSPAAQITVSGVTDMIARQYDQYVLVEPGMGATLPILGVLAGGPAGAAAGLVLQTLFERPLRGITQARYAVTGSWEDPVVELVEARVADEEGGETEVIPPNDAPPD